jgi:hypothetical protein
VRLEQQVQPGLQDRQDHRGLRGIPGWQGPLEHKDHRVSLELKEILDSRGLRAIRGIPAQQEQLDLRDQQAHKDLQDQRDLKGQ